MFSFQIEEHNFLIDIRGPNLRIRTASIIEDVNRLRDSLTLFLSKIDSVLDDYENSIKDPIPNANFEAVRLIGVENLPTLKLKKGFEKQNGKQILNVEFEYTGKCEAPTKVVVTISSDKEATLFRSNFAKYLDRFNTMTISPVSSRTSGEEYKRSSPYKWIEKSISQKSRNVSPPKVPERQPTRYSTPPKVPERPPTKYSTPPKVPERQSTLAERLSQRLKSSENNTGILRESYTKPGNQRNSTDVLRESYNSTISRNGSNFSNSITKNPDTIDTDTNRIISLIRGNQFRVSNDESESVPMDISRTPVNSSFSRNQSQTKLTSFQQYREERQRRDKEEQEARRTMSQFYDGDDLDAIVKSIVERKMDIEAVAEMVNAFGTDEAFNEIMAGNI